MTAIEDLRKAADVLCQRAVTARPGPWEHDGDGTVSTPAADFITEAHSKCDAEWIVLMNPLVAFPLAAMLQQAAQNAETLGSAWGPDSPDKYVEPNALQVARIILNADITIKAAQEAP